MRFLRRTPQGISDASGPSNADPSSASADEGATKASPPGGDFAGRAGLFVQLMSELVPTLDLDYSAESLVRLDSFVAQLFDVATGPKAPENFWVDVGCYVGEVVLRTIGGSWQANGALADISAEVKEAFPIDRARRRFERGMSESFATFYGAILRHSRPPA